MQVYFMVDSFSKLWLARGVAERELPNFKSFAGIGTVEVQKFVRADFGKAKHRGNMTTPVEFYVEREHESNEAANTFYFQHAMDLQGLEGTFVFVSEDGFSQASFYLKDAALESVTFAEPPTGVSTVATYRIIGGRIDPQP